MPHERHFVLPNAFGSATVNELVAGKEIQAMPYGEWDHPLYGKVSITPEIADTYKKNFDDRVYGQDIPLSFEHFGLDAAKGNKAAGWVKDVRVGDDGVYWTVAFTEEAAKEVEDGAWRYFSPEMYDEWLDPATSKKHDNVIVGGALTNRPFFKGMVPLNFSELLTAEGSVADIEHSEPGTTDPRVDDKEPDSQDGQGTRGPSPVIEPEDNMEEFLKLLREKLGLEEDATEENVLIAASELVAEVAPLREAAATAGERMTFSERFPAEFKRMAALEAAERENKARAFAERYANKRLVEGEGEAAVATPFGFSALTIDNVEKMHLAFAEQKLTQEDIEAVLESLLNTGLVDYSERGTSVEDSASIENAPQAFAEKVASIQVEDKIEYRDAVKLAAERHPELFKAYRETYSHRQ
jgi:hypothetical protein